MKEKWKYLLANKMYFIIWLLSLAVAFGALNLVRIYLCFNETRETTTQLNDIILNNLEPADVSQTLFAIMWISIIVSITTMFRSPKKAMLLFWATTAIGLLRIMCLQLFPLLPPSDLIPLRDTFLEGSFYGNNILVKDLFFSGHTSSMMLLAFLVDYKWLKNVLIIGTFVVGFLLLKQHAHYTIDVIAAPFFSYIAYILSVRITNYLFDLSNNKKKIVELELVEA